MTVCRRYELYHLLRVPHLQYITEHKNEFTTPGEDRAERNHRESMKRLEMRSRRLALGISNKGIGSVEIRDDEDEE